MLLLTACGGSDKAATVSLADGNLLLTGSHGGSGAAWGLSECQGCHALSVIHQRADLIRLIVQSKGYDSCTGCHGSNGTDKPRQCTLCHNNHDLPSKPDLTAALRHSFTPDSTSELQDEQCLVCHLGSDMNGSFEANRDLTLLTDSRQLYPSYTSTSEFCLRCHNRDHQQPGFEIVTDYDDPLVAMEDYYLYVDKHGETPGSGVRTFSGLRDNYSYSSQLECTDCHAMHGTENQGLIIDSSDKGLSQMDPGIRNQPHSIETVSGNTAQLCVMCHQMEVILDSGDLDTGNGLSGVHEISGNCLTCHSHGEAVQAGM